jgi:hypothetical protein
MAIETLFGPSIADVQELRRQQQEREIAGAGGQFGVFAPLYQASLRFGNQAVQGMNTLLGAQDPMLKKAADVQAILSQYQGQDLTDASVLKRIASDLASKGYTQESFRVAQDAAKATAQAEEISLRKRQVGVQEKDVGIKEAKATQGNLTNFVTKKGDAIIEKEGRLYVQKVDDEGVVSLDPYKKATHGAFETKADYAAAQAAAGAVVRQPIVDPRTGFTTGYIILDRNGNEIRRETFGAQSAGAGAAPQGTGSGGAVPNIYQQELDRRLKNK